MGIAVFWEYYGSLLMKLLLNKVLKVVLSAMIRAKHGVCRSVKQTMVVRLSMLRGKVSEVAFTFSVK